MNVLDPDQIRNAAMQVLTPQDMQVIAASVTPEFIQVMTKLFGKQATDILQPLASLPQMPGAPQANSLAAFSSAAQANGNPQPPEAQGMGGMPDMMGGAEDDMEDMPCPHCGGNDPNCPACSQPAPTPVNFRR